MKKVYMMPTVKVQTVVANSMICQSVTIVEGEKASQEAGMDTKSRDSWDEGGLW